MMARSRFSQKLEIPAPRIKLRLYSRQLQKSGWPKLGMPASPDKFRLIKEPVDNHLVTRLDTRTV
jgi:hypothetical protein